MGYAIDTIRQLNNKLYKALDVLEPLSEYEHDDSDPLNPNYTTSSLTGIAQVNTAVVCKLDETVVYNKDDKKYYIFDNSAGTVDIGGGYYEVDFTAQIPPTPVNFTETLSGHRHSVYHPENTPLKWKDLGYVNKYKCIDQSLSSQTVVAGDMHMKFNVSKADNLFLFNIEASRVYIKITHNATGKIITELNEGLAGKSRGTFYGFWFYDYNYDTRLSLEFPLYIDINIEITLYCFSGVSKCGLVGVGVGEKIGATLYGAGIGIIDFSKKEVNPSGETYLEVGQYKATNNLTVDVPSKSTDNVIHRLTSLRATPIVFKGSKEYESTYIFGIYNKWEMLISRPTFDRLSLDLESLT